MFVQVARAAPLPDLEGQLPITERLERAYSDDIGAAAGGDRRCPGSGSRGWL